MRFTAAASAMAIATIITSPDVRAQTSAEIAAAKIVSRMSAEEKASQLSSTSPAVSSIGIPAYQWWNEGLHGVVSREDSTNFPAPIGLAATFDTDLLGSVATAISKEGRALHANHRASGTVGAFGEGGGLDVWAPNINIFRDPRWGRGQETYGEDPYLTAAMGVAYIQGVQGPDPASPRMIATPKHFAVHSGPEPTRRSADVTVTAHDLEDTYLPAFRAAIGIGQAGSIMCSYNAVNGQPACANDFLLKSTLRGKWNFGGYVVTDCGAIEAIEQKHKYVSDPVSAVAVALKAGVDLECIHPNQPDIVKRYLDAVDRGLLEQADIDKAVTRLLAARISVGDIAPDGKAIAEKPQVVASPQHRQLALQSAQESLVLLKNNDLLPFKSPRKIVVTGPLADSVRVLRGNYSSPNVHAPVSLLAGIRAQYPGAEVIYVPAGPSLTDGDPVSVSQLWAADGSSGLDMQYYQMKIDDPNAPQKSIMAAGGPKFEEAPFQTGHADRLGQDVDSTRRFYKAVYSGYLEAKESGTYRIGLKGMFSKLTFDGSVLAELKGYPPPQLGQFTTVQLEKGKRYPFSVEAMKLQMLNVQMVWSRISEDPVAELRKAAEGADLIVAAVGINSDLESEESGLDTPGFYKGDRTNLDLPADQVALLEAAKATGRKLAVVNFSGSAMNLTWSEANADAVIQAWYPGEEGGRAIARTLSGASNPSGRLPVTFYRSIDDLPPFDSYAMKGRTYRYFTGTPLYPFGYGLSFSTFRYGKLRVTGSVANKTLVVKARVTNAGKLAGDEISQLYLTFPDKPGAPRIALRGFKRVHLKPGATVQFAFALSPEDLSSVSEDGVRKVIAGRYRISVGGGQPGTGAPTSEADLTISRELGLP